MKKPEKNNFPNAPRKIHLELDPDNQAASSEPYASDINTIPHASKLRNLSTAGANDEPLVRPPQPALTEGLHAYNPVRQPRPEPTPDELDAYRAIPAPASPYVPTHKPGATPPASAPDGQAAPTPRPHYIPPAPGRAPGNPRVTRVVRPSTKTTTPRKFFELSKTLPAFWTVTSVISLVVNVVLIVSLVLVGRELFTLKAMLGDQLLGGLYKNFIYMDQAHIRTTINVSDTIPVSFTLPIDQNSTVILSQDTPISGANVHISTGGITINSSANIVLPAGSRLPIHLKIDVPVTTSIPININVPVDIPLQQTDLHKPFIGLQQVVSPFYNLLQPQVKGPEDLPFCTSNPGVCSFYFNNK